MMDTTPAALLSRIPHGQYIVRETLEPIVAALVAAFAVEIETLHKDLVERTQGGSYAAELKQLKDQIDSFDSKYGGTYDELKRLDITTQDLSRVVIEKAEQGNKTASDLKQLRAELFGDEEKKKAWHDAKTNARYPNFPLPPGEKFEEPPPGAIDRAVGDLRTELRVALDTMRMDIAASRGQADKVFELLERTQKQLQFAQRLEAFFGPMLEGKNPPLDGNEIASKGYVDDAVRRIAGAIRGEVVDAVGFFKAAAKWSIGTPGHNDDREGLTAITRLLHRLSMMWDREKETLRREAGSKSRLQSLYHALTGRDGKERT